MSQTGSRESSQRTAYTKALSMQREGENITLGWKHVIKRLGMSRLSERPGHTTLTKGQYNQGQAEEAQVQHLREGRKKHCAEGWVRGHPS